MAGLTLSEFADKVNEIMPVITREFYKHGSDGFYKSKVTMAQFAVLDILVREGESRMTDLARLLNVTTAAMTGIVERLVRDGYIVRTSDSEDRRIIKVRPTAKGNKVVKSMAEQKKSICAKIFGIISETEREEYLRILTIVRDRLEEQRN